MKNKFLTILVLIVVSCSSKDSINNNNIYRQNNFINIDLIQLSADSQNVDCKLLIKIPTNKLVFNKTISGFESEISIDAIFTSNDKIVLNQSWSYDIMLNYFEETKSKEEIIIDKSLKLPSGAYSIDFIINDYKNHILWYKKTDIELDHDFKMSDILLYEKNNDNYSIKLDDTLEDLDTLWVQYQFNNLSNFKSYMDIKYDFFYIDNVLNKGSIELNEIYTDDDVIFKNDVRIKIDKNGTNYYPIKIIDEFYNGLVIKINYNDNYRYRTILLDRYKEIDYNFEKLVGPMEYILENSNFKDYREYTKLTNNDKIDYIIKYWDLEDSDKQFSNQIFEEFYKRVEYANRNFKYLTSDGWYSDRGRIYIIYGKPLEIKEEFTTDGEYQIWIYKNNKQFVFNNRFGPYKLIETNR